MSIRDKVDEGLRFWDRCDDEQRKRITAVLNCTGRPPFSFFVSDEYHPEWYYFLKAAAARRQSADDPDFFRICQTIAAEEQRNSYQPS